MREGGGEGVLGAGWRGRRPRCRATLAPGAPPDPPGGLGDGGQTGGQRGDLEVGRPRPQTAPQPRLEPVEPVELEVSPTDVESIYALVEFEMSFVAVVSPSLSIPRG